MTRFQSIKQVPTRTRLLLRDRFARKLRVYRQTRHGSPDAERLSDQLMLRLLQGLEFTFGNDWEFAKATYASASRSAKEPKDLDSLAETGWVRKVWGRVVIARDLRPTARRKPNTPRAAFEALAGQLYNRAYRVRREIRSDGELSALVASIEAGEKSPERISCPTPAWVAARLWEFQLAQDNGNPPNLRRWVDLWGLLGYPALVPGEVWQQGDAEAFRSAALNVIASQAAFGGWPETRAVFIRGMALSHNVSANSVALRIPAPPAALVDRALWLEGRMLEPSIHDALDSFGELSAMMRLLLADVAAADNSVAPHPMAAGLVDLAIDRPELVLNLLYQMRAHPVLLGDLVLHAPSAALACLLVAQWRAPSDPWEHSLVERDDRASQAEAFGDAASILGKYLKETKTAPAEAAALLNWFHERAGPTFVDDAVGNDVLLETLRQEFAGLSKPVLQAMAESLDGPDLRDGLGSSQFAAVLDLVDLGSLASDLEPVAIVEAYTHSIRAGEYRLSAHRVGVAGATGLARLAAQTHTLRQLFLYPLKIGDRLAAATADDNIFTLVDSIAHSIRAHLRILSRALVGSRGDIPEDLIDALIVAVKAGALEDKENGRIAAFAPRFEHSIGGPVRDRPLAADLGAALSILGGAKQPELLDAILETDEPHILAQLLSFGPPTLRAGIERRITALAPVDAGEVRSLPEMQARIDELLTAGAADAAARYMAAEIDLKTLGLVAGRETVRFRNGLRLHYLREEWEAILNAPKPAFKMHEDQASAEETLALFRGLAMLKGPSPNPESAKTLFADLFRRRTAAAYAINWFAAAASQLLSSDTFGLLKGAEIRRARHALAELEGMLARVPGATPTDDEVTACNKALLLLAVGEPSQALAILTAVPLIRLQDTAAAYRTIALTRLDQGIEALAVLEAAEQTYGATPVLVAVRAHLGSGLAIRTVPNVLAEDDQIRDVVSALARFRSMNPSDQARVLDQRSEPFEALVLDHVRAAADSVVSLVPMMRGVNIDLIEDDLTAFIQHLMTARVQFLNWSVHGQSPGGITEKGNSGKPDLQLKWGNTVLAPIEAVVCDQPLTHDSMCADLESHFQKLLGYGNGRLFFHLTYAYIEDKAGLMTFLETIAESSAPAGFRFKARERILQRDSRPPGFAATYDSDFGEVKVVFLVLNLGQQSQRQAAKAASSTKRRKSPRSTKK